LNPIVQLLLFCLYISVIPIKYVYTKLSFHYVYEMKNMTRNNVSSLLEIQSVVSLSLIIIMETYVMSFVLFFIPVYFNIQSNFVILNSDKAFT